MTASPWQAGEKTRDCMQRLVSPEWLDELPPDDARARRSRRDLQRLNALMGHAGIVAAVLERRWKGNAAGQWVELGAGDGSFALKMVSRLRGVIPIKEVTLVDRLAVASLEVQAGFAALNCAATFTTADVFDWLDRAGPVPAIVANLFLHHFQDRNLARLLELIAARTDLFVACEPHRSRLSLAASRLLGVIGCNEVTRHDAVISVRAGFTGDELSRLWPKSGGWHIEEQPRGLFSHVFAARRPIAGAQGKESFP